MKKLLITLLLIASVANTYAQKTNRTTFGVKGGLNMDDFRGTSDTLGISHTTQTTFYVGLFSETTLNDRWSIENELLYSHTHYIEIPVHLKYRFFKKWQVFLGPKLEIPLSKDDNLMNTEKYNKRLGLAIDAGVNYNITKHFFAELRYSYGLTEMVSFPAIDQFNSTKSTFRVGVGYKF